MDFTAISSTNFVRTYLYQAFFKKMWLKKSIFNYITYYRELYSAKIKIDLSRIGQFRLLMKSTSTARIDKHFWSLLPKTTVLETAHTAQYCDDNNQ